MAHDQTEEWLNSSGQVAQTYPDYSERYDYLDFTDAVCLKHLMEELTKKQQHVIILKYMHGLSDIEIAKKIHISRQAVNKLKRNAIATLKAML